MLLSIDLKSQIVLDAQWAECPVLGCQTRVQRQRRQFRCAPEFHCPIHQIYISPSTFEYADWRSNLLSRDPQDISLLASIAAHKRESRMGRERSEDAISWNFFRHLEHSDKLLSAINLLAGKPATRCNVIYWSYCQRERDAWSWLKKAREQFGEHPKRSTEPDIIMVSDHTLVFVEAKLTAANRTQPSTPGLKKYVSGADGLFGKIHRSSYEDVAVVGKLYELMRLWLMGNWIATQMNLEFRLIALVRDGAEPQLTERVARHFVESSTSLFQMITWERLFAASAPHTVSFTNYFHNKTVGFDQSGRLGKAFKM